MRDYRLLRYRERRQARLWQPPGFSAPSLQKRRIPVQYCPAGRPAAEQASYNPLTPLTERSAEFNPSLDGLSRSAGNQAASAWVPALGRREMVVPL